MLEIAEPIIPSICERTFSSSQQKFRSENQILACCCLWKTPRATERSTVEILLRDVGYTRRVVLAKCHSMLDFLVSMIFDLDVKGEHIFAVVIDRVCLQK